MSVLIQILIKEHPTIIESPVNVTTYPGRMEYIYDNNLLRSLLCFMEIIGACLLGTSDHQVIDTNMIRQLRAIKYCIRNI